MKKILLIAGAVFFLQTLSSAQQPAELLNEWASRSPIEKTYLHLDRDNYFAGETVWFKAYLYADFYPDTISTTLLVELTNNAATVIAKKVLPVIYGNTRGQFELPDTLPGGNYFIRAWSPTMLNHGDEFLFERSVYVHGKKNIAVQNDKLNAVRMEFFPESGNFVAELPNTIAFKISAENGQPLNATGVVRNEKGDSIAEITCYHDGMGMFDVKPQAGMKYYVVLHNDPGHQKFYLPAVSATGLVLRMMSNPQGKYFEIYQKPADASRQAAYMIGQMQHRVVFKMDLNPGKTDINGFINTSALRSGILQATVFTRDDMPLAERLCFIDNKEYIQPAALLTDTVDFSAKGRNHFTLSFPDTIGGTFSVSVTDPDYAVESMRKETMVSKLLLTSDLRGYVHDPQYYFTASSDSAAYALDLVMMINGWRRFKWAGLPQLAKAPLRYADPGYINISGKVNIRETKKPLPNKELFVFRSSKEDSLNVSVEFMQTDGQGRFRMDSMIFFGTTRFYISDVQGKKNKWLDIYPDEDSIITTYAMAPMSMDRFRFLLQSSAEANTRFSMAYDDILKANGTMLEEVTIKVRKKTPVQELEERYASGLFAGLTEKTIDLVNTKEKIFQNNIFDYIQGRVPGIQVMRRGLDYTLYYRQRMSLMGGAIPMMLYLNEMQSDARIIATIPANQVAMIKVYSSFVGAEGNGVGGVLAVYTKQGADLSSELTTSADIFQYKGYSVIREFYAPDYSVKPANNLPAGIKDHRITLHWWPDIIVDGSDTKVPLVFYNNERTKSFKVIVEGMTADGRMVFIEKLITPDKKSF